MEFKLVDEKPYDECTREELINALEVRDYNFRLLYEEHDRVKDGLANLVLSISNEGIQTNQMLQTELTLSRAGVPSENSEEVQIKVGRMQAFKSVCDYLLELLLNNKKENNAN